MTPLHLAARVALGLEPSLSLTVRTFGDTIELTLDLDMGSGLWRSDGDLPIDPISVAAHEWKSALLSVAPLVPAPPPPGVAKKHRTRMVRTDARATSAANQEG